MSQESIRLTRIRKHQTFEYDPEEQHTVSRRRTFLVSSLAEVYSVLSMLQDQCFSGEVRLHMSQGGFNGGITVEETIKLVAE